MGRLLDRDAVVAGRTSDPGRWVRGRDGHRAAFAGRQSV